MSTTTAATREVNGITLIRTYSGQPENTWLYRRDRGLTLRFTHDAAGWHVEVGKHSPYRGVSDEITTLPARWYELADAVQAARAGGLITWEASMPHTMQARDMEGHLREYTVVDRYANGTLMSGSSWNAPHLDTCPCYTSVDW